MGGKPRPPKPGKLLEQLATIESFFLHSNRATDRAAMAPIWEYFWAGVRQLRELDFAAEEHPLYYPEMPRESGDWGAVATTPKGLLASEVATDDLHFATVGALGAQLRAGKTTSVALTELTLRRLKDHDPVLRCVVNLTEELALEQAAQADRELAAGRDRGPLHGIPYGAKDIIDTAGIPTTWGIGMHKGRRPSTDATVIARLADAGAVLAAKLSTGALACGDVWFAGQTRNPWNSEEGASGSSAGSCAAVAAGLVPFALGSETLGSIISPSTRCGPVGFRPTFGLVPRTGVMTLSWSMDKVGAIARRVEDAVDVLAAIAGPDPGDPGVWPGTIAWHDREPIAGRRVGYDPRWFDADHVTDAERGVLSALRGLGVELIEVELASFPGELFVPGMFVEIAAAREDFIRAGEDREHPDWRGVLRAARLIPAEHFVQLQRLRRRVYAALEAMLGGVDAVISPSLTESLILGGNVTGHPMVAVRAGFLEARTRPGHGNEQVKTGDRHRVPVSVTVMGHRLGDGRMAAVAAALESELGVWQQRPPFYS